MGLQGATLEVNEVTIDHITVLAQVRSLMPYPAWREPSVHNLFLEGFVTDDRTPVSA